MSERNQPNGWFEQHVVDTLKQLQEDLTVTRIDLAAHKAKTGILAGLISMVVAAITGYFLKP